MKVNDEVIYPDSRLLVISRTSGDKAVTPDVDIAGREKTWRFGTCSYATTANHAIVLGFKQIIIIINNNNNGN